MPKTITLNLSDVDTSNFENARSLLKGEEWESFKADIKKKGVINNPTVRRNAGQWELIAGFRRFAAAEELELETLDFKAYDTEDNLTDADARAINLVENLQRVDLHWTETAWGMAQLERDGFTPGRIKGALNCSQAQVSQHLALAHAGFFQTALDRRAAGESNLAAYEALAVEKASREKTQPQAVDLYLLELDKKENPDKYKGEEEGEEGEEGGDTTDSGVKRKAKFFVNAETAKWYISNIKDETSDYAAGVRDALKYITSEKDKTLVERLPAVAGPQEEEEEKPKKRGRKTNKERANRSTAN